jgi:hypothetical protein
MAMVLGSWLGAGGDRSRLRPVDPAADQAGQRADVEVGAAAQLGQDPLGADQPAGGVVVQVATGEQSVGEAKAVDEALAIAGLGVGAAHGNGLRMRRAKW